MGNPNTHAPGHSVTSPKELIESFSWLLDAGIALRNAEFAELDRLRSRSNEWLRPLGEPLDQDLGLNRWLAGAREEIYSDWLAWLFSLMTPHEIADVLALPELRGQEYDQVDEMIIVEREVWVDNGHEGQRGRVDILLEIHGRALVVVEVKLGSADAADTAKQIGYVRSIEQSRRYSKYKGKIKFVLLATDGSKPEYHGFSIRKYDIFCRNLRRLACSWINEKNKLFHAALLLAFTATTESNVLKISIQKSCFSPSSISYFQQLLERQNYE
jgi:hypothetical protein